VFADAFKRSRLMRSNWENEKRKVPSDILLKIAKVFKKDLSFFMPHE
jgi:transcriptional regulator with XRE-family HTH domain